MKPRTLLALALASIAVIILLVAFGLRGRPGDSARASVPRADEPRSDPNAHQSANSQPMTPIADAATGAFAAPTETVRDAQLRAQLQRALARVFASGADASSAASESSSPNGNLDPTYLRERIRNDFIPMAQRCFELLQTRRPGFGGRMLMRFQISAHESLGGIVEDVSIDDGSPRGDASDDASLSDGSRSTFGDQSFETCVRESMMTVAFSPPSRGGRLTVAYPLVLAPDPPDAGQ